MQNYQTRGVCQATPNDTWGFHSPHDNWIDLRLQGIRLTRSPSGECAVAFEVGGRWVGVIRDRGEVISHIVEPGGIAAALGAGGAG